MMQALVQSGVLAAVLTAFAGLAAFSSARVAEACSIALPTDARFSDWVERAPIVAIGRWEAVSAREVAFLVEQPLKGAKTGQRLAVDNRTTYTAFLCSPYDEPFREGYRFVPGERAVVLLEKEVDSLWQVGYMGLAAFEVPETVESPLAGIGWYFGDPEAGTPTDIKLSTIIAAAGNPEAPVSLFPVDRAAPDETAGGDGPWPAIALGFVFACAAAWLVVLRASGRI